MKTNRKFRRGFTLVELLVVIVIIAALAGLTAPMVIRQRKKADQTEATNNARQVGFAMLSFETEYGSYPDSDTAITVEENTQSGMNFSGTSSNAYFRQLFAAGYTDSEAIFYAKTPNSRKPDDVTVPVAKTLAAGEVGFGYLMDGDTGYSTAGKSSRPIVVTPLLDNQVTGQFDPDPFDGRAVVLRMDNSVAAIQIRKTDKQITLGGGNTLLKTGEATVWGTGSTPTIRAPEKKGGN